MDYADEQEIKARKRKRNIQVLLSAAALVIAVGAVVGIVVNKRSNEAKAADELVAAQIERSSFVLWMGLTPSEKTGLCESMKTKPNKTIDVLGKVFEGKPYEFAKLTSFVLLIEAQCSVRPA